MRDTLAEVQKDCTDYLFGLEGKGRKYRAFENGVRCSEYNIKGFPIDTFDNKRKAEVFCHVWAFPVSLESAKQFAPEMEIGKEYDFSMGEVPVLMKIEEVFE